MRSATGEQRSQTERVPAIKKNEMMPCATTQMDLEMTILSEVRQRQVHHLYVEPKKKKK